ncbi:MAG: hypothetical protein AB4426_28740 [Xenococcaceae cyanobacterium]
MKTLLLNIQPLPDTDSLKVIMSIGDKQHQFTFSRKFDQIGLRQLQIITYESDFGETFKFNQHIIGEVLNLVRQFYRDDVLEFPIDVGNFGTSEQGLALQKPFKPKTLDKSPVL